MNLAITPRRALIYGSIGAAALIFSVMGQSSDDTGAAVAHAPGERSAPRTSGAALTANAAEILTRLAHRSVASKSADALFAARSWYVAPPPAPAAPAPPPGPPPAPAAPPLPFIFLGSYAAQGDAATYFLSRGDRIYDVRAGDGIDADYTLIAVDGVNMIFNYKPLNVRQSLPLGGIP